MLSKILSFLGTLLFPAVDFGEFGVLMRDEETGELRPMVGADMLAMQEETDEAVADWWFKKEAEAFAIHGDGITRVQ